LSRPPTVRLIDRAVVKGKSVPLELMEVRHSFSPDAFEEIARRYNEAFSEYERGNFSEAERLFAALQGEHNDKPSGIMADRCGELAANPPGEWNGTYQLTTK
jgi:hypothetical protein